MILLSFNVIMIYTELLFNLPNDLLSQVRKLENVKNKISRAEWSQHFNNVCLQENLMPNYTRICKVCSGISGHQSEESTHVTSLMTSYLLTSWL